MRFFEIVDRKLEQIRRSLVLLAAGAQTAEERFKVDRSVFHRPAEGNGDPLALLLSMTKTRMPRQLKALLFGDGQGALDLRFGALLAQHKLIGASHEIDQA